MLRLHDTATGAVTEVIARDPGRIGLYVCGPTVYGPPHIGHGRTTLVYDVLRRYLEYRGYVVDHVSNITDIDDKIMALARDEGRPWHDIADANELAWWAAMDRLGVKRPTHIPHATDYVAQMVEMIDALVARGAAYETSDGVYLSVASVPGYGLLAHQSLESLRAGARVDVLEEKRASVDFALWKKAKPDEPTWPSPWGPGHPGWHTECVVMSIGLLGENFDIHSGGQDLMFPHHENERAQAVALGRGFAHRWMHNGLVTVGAEKMSKSLGNFTLLTDLLDHADARSYRLLVLRSNYRSPLEVNGEILDDAAATIARLDALQRRFPDVSVTTGAEDRVADVAALQAEGEATVARFVAAMDDDLDTPGALAGLFEAMHRANALADRGEEVAARALARVVIELFAALGLVATSETALASEDEDLVARRDAARSARDFATADQLRDALQARGWRVEDTPGGTRLSR